MNISLRIKQLYDLIHQTEALSHRSKDSVKLLAVSKHHPIDAIVEAFHAGIRDFGENYLQEALLKINALSHLSMHWHYIGAIQSKKAKVIAQHFDWVHTVSSHKIADYLNDARSIDLPVLNVCIQLNLDLEDNKAGILPKDTLELATHIQTLPRLALRGLMVIPKIELDTNKQYESFLRVTHLFDALNKQLDYPMDTLSMGMSEDFTAAIRAGSTIIRIGTAIFGART